MTDLLSEVEAPSDAELISRVRGGDVAAYGELFTRHKDAANRLARQLVRGSDADDLVAEAFAKVLTVLQSGGGPDVAFRAYLLTAVRRLHVDRVRAAQRVQTTDDLTPFDPGVPFKDTAVAGFETGAAAKAFASLPERWQLVLWHLEVEGQKPADIAPLLGMSPNSVSALAYRAREGLRQAFLTMHISDLTETDCRWVNEHLGAFIRKGLSKRDAAKVQDHLDGCRRCTAMYLELTEVNDNLAAIIAPLLLGAAATGYLASTGVGAVGLLGLLSKFKEQVAANSGAASAAAVTVGIVAAAVAVFTIATGGNHPEAKAPDAPVGVTSPAASPGTGVPSEVSPSVSPAPTAAPTIAPTATLSPAALFPSIASLPSSTGAAAPTDTAPAGTVPTVAAPAGTAPVSTPPDSAPADTPTAEPTDSVSTDIPVSLEGTTVDDDGVHLRAAGSPLPPSITVLLTSTSDNVGFANNGDCPVADGGRQATCDLSPGGAGGRVPGTAVAAASTSFAADLPFNSLDDEPDVDIQVEFVLPSGFRVEGADVVTTFQHVLRQDVDIALSIPDSALRPQASGDVYRVPATLGVIGVAQNRVEDVTYTASGGRFIASDGTLSPSVTRSRSDDLRFDVVPDNPERPVFSITASLPLPLVDGNSGNDTAPAALSPYDVSLTALTPATSTADENGNQLFTATVNDDGFPGEVAYSLLDDPTNPTSPGTPLTPTSVDGNSVTFTLSGDVDRKVGIRAALPTGYTDGDPSNNTSVADFTASDAVDVALDAFRTELRPGPNDVYSVSPSVSVSGPAADRVSAVTYAVAGGTFTDGSSSISRTLDDARPLQIVPAEPAAPAVTLTASVASPFVDTDPTNDSRPVPLRRYDVHLTDLAPNTPTANADGVQEFVATVDDEGLEGVTYRLQNPLLGDVIVDEPRKEGHKVAVSVRSTSARTHPITLEAVPPIGFTDDNTGDNAATARWTPAPPVTLTTDLRLSSLRPDRPVPDKNDGRYHLGTTLNVSGDRPPTATLSIESSAATFVSVDGCTVAPDRKQATCKIAAHGATPLELVLSAPTDLETPVTITVNAPPPFTDFDPDNNEQSTTLFPTPAHRTGDVDVALSVGPGPLRPHADRIYSVRTTVSLTGPAAEQLSKVTYTITGGSLVSGKTTIKRPANLAAPRFEVVPDDLTSPHVNLTASVTWPFRDTDPGDDMVALPLKPYDVAPSRGEPKRRPAAEGAAPVDVRLLSLSPAFVRPDADEQYTVTGMVSMDGRHARDLTHIDYSVTGAEFTANGDCTATTCTMSATGTPTFQLHRLPGSGSPRISIRAHVPAGFRDIDPDNDSASAFLKPYDVSLSDLSAETSTAGEDGNQTFSARFGSDGIDSDDIPVSFELADGPPDARLTHGWVSNGRATFSVHSETDTSHPVAVRAVLPHGFTDADPANNTATGATFTPHPRIADLRLSASFASYDKDDHHGVIAVTVENAPQGMLTFALIAHQPVDLTDSADCRLAADRQSASCQVSRLGTFSTTFGIDLPPGQAVSMTVTAGGYDNPDESDNTAVLGKP
ncbi:MAG: sigma-70 family RNA polymerase sigma factor [Nocardioidaceae bacterium]